MNYKQQQQQSVICLICNVKFVKKLIFFGCCVFLIVFISSIDSNVSNDAEEVEMENVNFWSNADAISWMAEMSAKMIERKHHLKKKCVEYGLDKAGNDTLHTPNTWEYLINRPHHIVWCNVFKAASTSWMYNFNILAGYKAKYLQQTKEVPLQLARKKYPRPTLGMLKTAINDSISFLIVRHPFERLLSGYRDKIEHALPHTYHQKLGTSIITKYRKGGADLVKLRKKGRKVHQYPTFQEFVEYLIDNYKNGEEFDMHWAPVNNFCTPCQIDLNIIIKFETLQDDQNFLIHLAKLERIIKPQWKNPSKGKSNTQDLMKQYYSQLTQKQISQLYEIYKYDFEIFGYELDVDMEHVDNW